jgi:hypothetical protein
MTLQNRLDARLPDQMAQPYQNWEAKYRGCADPSRLQDLDQSGKAVMRSIRSTPIIVARLRESVNLLRYVMACDACTRGGLRRHPVHAAPHGCQRRHTA